MKNIIVRVLAIVSIIIGFAGCCDEPRTYVPDDVFEYALIYWGYDDVLDDYVLTKNIKDVKQLSFGEPGFVSPFNLDDPPIDRARINDFTGIEDFESLERFYLQQHGEHLDLSNNKKLTEVIFYEAYNIKSLNLKNGNNTNMTFAYYAANALGCIQVDDKAWADANWDRSRIGGALDTQFEEDCHYVIP